MRCLHASVSHRWVAGRYHGHFATNGSCKNIHHLTLKKVEAAYAHKMEIIFISAKPFKSVQFCTQRFGEPGIYLA